MITISVAFLMNNEIFEYIGFILIGLEILLVAIKFMQYFIDPKSKIGIFLQKTLKGITFIKGEVKKIDDRRNARSNIDASGDTEGGTGGEGVIGRRKDEGDGGDKLPS